MKHKTNWQKSSAILILAILLISSCNQFYGASSIPAPDSQKTPPNESATTPSPSTFKPGDPTATPLGSEITDPNFIKGVDAFYADNDNEVIRLMSAVIEANPNLAPPYRYRGISYWYLGDCVSGLADEEKALSIDPNYAAAWAGHGLTNSCLGNTEQAFKDYQKALSIDPSLAFVHENLGVDYYNQGIYEKSLEEYSLSAAIDPTRSGAWLGKAEALTQLGRFDECITNATKTLKVNPNEWLAYDHRAYCEQFTGDNIAVVQDYKIFLEHNPESRDAWNNIGLAQTTLGLNSDALVSLNKALELDPVYYQANINRGWAYIALGEFDKALDDFNRALEFGEIPAAYSGRGTAYYWLKRYDEAILDLELAASAMPNRPHSYCMLAYTYFEVERYQDALDAANRVNEIAPGCGGEKLFVVQAHSYYALGQYEQGITFITTAFEDQHQYYMAGYYYRGIMYDELGQSQEAIKDLEFFLAGSKYLTGYDEQIADAKVRFAKLKP